MVQVAKTLVGKRFSHGSQLGSTWYTSEVTWNKTTVPKTSDTSFENFLMTTDDVLRQMFAL
jgi:hypothetical protein